MDDEIESQIFILNDKHSDFKYRNFKSQRSKKNRRGKNKWVLRKKTAVDIISYIEEKRCVI
jgi:hypothetical protein